MRAGPDRPRGRQRPAPARARRVGRRRTPAPREDERADLAHPAQRQHARQRGPARAAARPGHRSRPRRAPRPDRRRSGRAPRLGRDRARRRADDRRPRSVHDAVPPSRPRLRHHSRGGPGGHRARRPPRLHRGLRGRALQLVERAHHVAPHLPGHAGAAHAADPLRHGRHQPAPDAPGHRGRARRHVRPPVPRPLHHGHRAGRAGERPRDVRRGPGRAAAPDGARVDRHDPPALEPGPALRDRRPLLEDLAREQHLARVQGGVRAAAVPAAAPAHRALDPHAELRSARTAGERGWIPISGQFFHRRYLRGHWENYVEGCEAVGRRPDPRCGASRAASS